MEKNKRLTYYDWFVFYKMYYKMFGLARLKEKYEDAKAHDSSWTYHVDRPSYVLSLAAMKEVIERIENDDIEFNKK